LKVKRRGKGAHRSHVSGTKRWTRFAARVGLIDKRADRIEALNEKLKRRK